MANSFFDTLADGSTTIFSVPFGYLDPFHVSVLVDGDPVAFEWIGSATVSVFPAPALGATVRVRRITPKDPVVDFRDGESLTEADLDSVSLQSLYLSQEAEDNLGAVLQVIETGQYDATNRRIQNLADPVDAQDAVTKLWAETSMTSTLAQAIAARVAAQAAQAAAETARNAAQASQTSAAASQTSASGSATSAAGSASSAAASASTATTKANEATASAATASGHASAAAGSASSASASAATATAQAGVATTKAAEAAVSADDAEFFSSQVQGNIIPVGSIMFFASTTAPSGWLVCDGSRVTTVYPELRSFLTAAGNPWGTEFGDPKLPDLRGEFVRGWDGGRGVDTGRSFGSSQGDQNKDHTHGVTDPGHTHSIVRYNTGGSGQSGSYASYSAALTTTTVQSASAVTGISVQSSGGSEARPRNVALLPCIKAFGQIDITGSAQLSELLASIATNAEAIAGTSNTKLMTPLRVDEVVDDRINSRLGQQIQTGNTVAGAGFTVPISQGASLSESRSSSGSVTLTIQDLPVFEVIRAGSIRITATQSGGTMSFRIKKNGTLVSTVTTGSVSVDVTVAASDEISIEASSSATFGTNGGSLTYSVSNIRVGFAADPGVWRY